MNRFPTAYEWFNWIATLHPKEMDLGLDRVRLVAERLQILKFDIPVIVVAGTNGKGSTVRGLEKIYLAAGYHTGVFTSPFLFEHNEEVRVNGEDSKDAEWLLAFEEIDKLRGDVTLTTFEFHTLAALLILKNHELDVMILEIGLGGRLDAVNIIDADVSIVTTISLDHMAWLGNTREAIAYEKAGIFRAGKPAVCGDFNPPHTLIDHAKTIKAPLYSQGNNFVYHVAENGWSWQFENIAYANLPLPKLAIQNMATVLMAVTLLQARLPVSRSAIDAGLLNLSLPGRFEVHKGDVTEIYDVAHNEESVGRLKEQILALPHAEKVHAVFSMLGDKDILTCVNIIKSVITDWHIAPLTDKRAASSDTLQKTFKEADITQVNFYESVAAAHLAAKQKASVGDHIVVFGSFRTVAEVNSCGGHAKSALSTLHSKTLTKLL